MEGENEKIIPDEGGAGATHEAGGLAHDYQPGHQSALLKKVFLYRWPFTL